MTDVATIPGIAVGITNTVQIAWKGEHLFDAHRPNGPMVRIDASAKTGPSPVDALLIALGTCTSVDVVDILAKRRTPVATLNVEVVAKRADAVPRRVIGALITYTITGEGIERVHAQRAIDLAIEKYCSVRDSLDPKLPVSSRLLLNGEG